MYITLFSQVIPKLDWARALAGWWRKASGQTKAILSVVVLAVVTLILGALAVYTPLVYLFLLPLGIFYGVVVSYPVIRFFGPKLQSLATGFLGGITIGNIGTQEAKLRSYVIVAGEKIKEAIVGLNPPDTARAARLDGAIVWSIWTAILVCLAILAANAYFANKDGNPVGQPVPAGPPAQQAPPVPPVPPANPAAPAQQAARQGQG